MKIIKVGKCGECPYHKGWLSNATDVKYYCDSLAHTEIDPETVHPNCPLPDDAYQADAERFIPLIDAEGK